MNLYTHHKINTYGNYLVGTKWYFGKNIVEMFDKGFGCTCKEKTKCGHIKSVEFGILGVGQVYHK